MIYRCLEEYFLTMRFWGKAYFQQQQWYDYLIFPVAVFKKVSQQIYRLLAKAIWSELTTAIPQEEEQDLYTLFLFIVVLIFSWLFYQLKKYQIILLCGFCFIWYLDYCLAKSRFFYGKKSKILVETKEDSSIVWQMYRGDGSNLKHRFALAEIHHIYLQEKIQLGGTFQEAIATVWQIKFALPNGDSFCCSEEVNFLKAWRQAKWLAESLSLSLVVAESEGSSQYAATMIPTDVYYYNQSPSNIILKKNKSKWHLFYQWRLSNSWQLIKQIFQETGYGIFLLFFGSFLYHVGWFIDQIVSGNSSERVIDLNIGYDWLTWDLFGSNFLNILLALLIVVYKGWQLSRQKHIYIDKFETIFAIDHQTRAKLATPEIECVLLLTQSSPKILLVGEKGIISISKFQRQAELKDFFIHLNYMINQFNSSEQHQQTLS